MDNRNVIDREQLCELVKNAKRKIRILGAVAFDLPYEEYQYDWHKRVNEGTLRVDIVCESEADLTYSSLLSADKRLSGDWRSYDIGNFTRMRNEPKIKLRDYFANNGCKHIEPKGDLLGDRKDEEQYFSLRTCFWRIPVPVIDIDDDYYYTLSLTKFCSRERFEKITEDNVWYEEFKQYFYAYFDADLGAKKYSSEITAKDNRTEIISMYNDNRHCLGQLPRESFLNITKAKLVVWGMLFTRDGRVLIHKRADNAKDNRGLWDKSIGGHVDMEKDTVDTVKAAAREALEELYKIEAKDQEAHTADEIRKIDPNVPMFMGEWREEMRTTLPFKEIINKKDKIYFFRMSYDFSKQAIDSPRILPDDTESPVKCFADMYVFIMNEDFEKGKLENSSFKLLELHELHDCHLGEDIEYIDKDTGRTKTEKFRATPDLKKIITGKLWPELNAFADYLKEGLRANK